MESKRVSFVTLFIGLLCVGLLVNSASGREEWHVYQGPCSKYPDCNKHCIKGGFGDAGKCMVNPNDKKGPLVCVCITY
ncbi:hypothetical protein ABFS83_04G050700 [Erythranthe nasuta]